MLRSSPEPLKLHDNAGTVFVAGNSIGTIVKKCITEFSLPYTSAQKVRSPL